MKSISVAIPVRIIDPEQYRALLRSLNSIFSQSYRPLDVIISIDGATKDLIKNLQEEFDTKNLLVVHNPENPGIASNSNNAFTHCKGDLVHILHQDDEIISKYCYERVLEKFEAEEFKWLLLEGQSKAGKKIEPVFDRYTKFGINKIGGPSGLIVTRDSFIPYNTNYSMMTDVVNFELYFQKYGPPSVLPQPWILYGDLRSSASRSISRKAVIQELQMIYDEFKVPNEEIWLMIANSQLDLTHRKLVFDSIKTSLSRSRRRIFSFSYTLRKLLRKLQFLSRHRLRQIFRSGTK